MSLSKTQLEERMIMEQRLLMRFHEFLVNKGVAAEGFDSARLALVFLEPEYSDTTVDNAYVAYEAKSIKESQKEALNGLR